MEETEIDDQPTRRSTKQEGHRRARRTRETESIEAMLSLAFKPVEPPEHLYRRLESKLERLSVAASEELSELELAAMSDPRNWVRPAAALAVSGAAAGALVVLGMRSRRRSESSEAALKALGGALTDVRREVERSAKKIIP